MMVSISIISLVIFGLTDLLVVSGSSSARVQSQTQVDTDVALAAEQVKSYLYDARVVTVSADGNSLTYQKPLMGPNGYYVADGTSVEADSHTLYLSNGCLYSSDYPNSPILQNIPQNDPTTQTTLVPFTVGYNSNQILIRLASSVTIVKTGLTRYAAATVWIRPQNM
jgi:hypothetical protein